MGGPETLFKPIEQFLSQFGIDHAMSWRLVATMVIVVETLLALFYLVAVTQDRSRRRLVRVCCWLGLVLALGLHINNELIEIDIRWLSYYMMVIAGAFYLPHSWLRAAAAVTWPGRRFERMLGRYSDRWPGIDSDAGLLVAALAIAPGMVFVGRVIDLPGAIASCAVAAVALVVVAVWAVQRGSPAVARNLIVTVTGAVMWVAVANLSGRAEFYTNRGNDLRLLEEPKLALDAYKKAVRYTPRGDANPSYNLGMMFAALRKNDRAVEQFQQALQIDRNYVKAHNNLGVMLFEQGEYKRAMEHYNKALRLAPDYVDAHVNVGNVLRVFGRTDKAMQHYREALTLDHMQANAHFNLALLLADQNKLDQAIEHLHQVLSINPRDSGTHYHLASALHMQGHLQSAIQHYRRTLQFNPQHARARQTLDQLMASSGQTERDLPSLGPMRGTAYISQQEVLDHLGSDAAPLILDVRSGQEFDRGHLPGAINIPHTQLAQRLVEIRSYQDRRIVVHCEAGRRANLAEQVLRQAGFTDVRHLRGDMLTWRQNRMPIHKTTQP